MKLNKLILGFVLFSMIMVLACGGGAADEPASEIKAEPTKHAIGAGGEHPKKKLKSITNDSFEQKKDSLLDKKTSYFYGKLPEPNLEQCLTSYKTFLKDFRNHISTARR